MAASCRSPRARRGPRRSSPRSARPRRPTDHGEAPLRAVHSEAYLAFLRSAHEDWRAAGRDGRRERLCLAGGRGAGRSRSTGSTPGSAATASTRRARSPPGPGRAPIGRRRRALTALDALLAGERAAFALCRPPGHHAGARLSRRLLLPQQRRHRRRGRDRRGPAAGRDPRHRLSSRQRHPGHLLRAAATSCSSRSTPIRATDYPYLLGPCRRDRRRRGRRRDAQPAAAARHRSRRLPARRSTRRWRGSPLSRRICSSSPTAPTPSPAIRSRISRWRRPIMPRIGRRIAALGLPTPGRDGGRLCGRRARRQRRRPSFPASRASRSAPARS